MILGKFYFCYLQCFINEFLMIKWINLRVNCRVISKIHDSQYLNKAVPWFCLHRFNSTAKNLFQAEFLIVFLPIYFRHKQTVPNPTNDRHSNFSCLVKHCKLNIKMIFDQNRNHAALKEFADMSFTCYK